MERSAKLYVKSKVVQGRTATRFWWLLALYSLFLLFTTGYIAVHRHLWFDEVDTFFVATLPSFQAIWRTLLLGADGQPIGFYVPVHLSYLLFGPSELAIRLCAIIPFWLTTLVLYYAVTRRTSPLYGFIAALAPPFTVAFQYSFEARPYALVLFFSACSFLAWQFAKEGRMRVISLPAITFALAAAICSHYNAVLIVLPILIGEATYSIRHRKADIGVLVAIGASGVPLLFLLPHIHAIHVYSKTPWSHSNFGTLAEIYFVLLAKFFVLAMIGCVGFGLWVALSEIRPPQIGADFKTIPPYEVAASGGYLILPVACFILSFYTRALHYRYVIAAVVGLSIFIPFALWIYRAFLPKIAGALCVLMTLNLIYTATSRVRTPDEDDWGTVAAYSGLFSPATKDIYQSNEDLVLGDGSFLVTAKYGNSALRGKSFYLLSHGQGQNNSPVIFRGLQSAVSGPFHIVELNDFKEGRSLFMMYDPDPWLLNRLVAEGNNVRIIAELQHGPLYEVRLK